MNKSEIQLALEKLRDAGVESKQSTAYLDQIRSKEEFLADLHHPIYFIGPVGVGKSSLIAVAAQLLVDVAAPTSKNDLRQQSVLATGAGRTTVCEVEIKQLPKSSSTIRLTVTPLSQEEMADEIKEYAIDVWQTANQPEDNAHTESSADGQEIQRFIRNMCGYPDETENTYQDGIRKRRSIKPFVEAAKTVADAESFAAQMLHAARLSLRTQTEWEFTGERHECMQKTKELFAELNQGTQAHAMLPSRITLHVAETMPESGKPFTVNWIDTRGLDGGMESRADLQDCLRDERALFVLCTSFNDAPNESIKAVLRVMHSNRQFHSALTRSLLILVDADNAASVNGADGERDLGQILKLDECSNALRPLNLGDLFTPSQMVAFDVLQDDRSQLIYQITNGIDKLRKAQETELEQLCLEAEFFCRNADDQRRKVLQESIKQQIEIALTTHFTNIGADSMLDAPLTAPITGAINSIRNTAYASRVRASCRRAGKFSNFDMYAVTHFYAASQASLWLNDLLQPIQQTLSPLAQDADLDYGKDIIDNLQREYQLAANTIVTDYADSVRDEMLALLWQPVRDKDAESLSYKTWQKCVSEWGKGDGFKERVVNHLQAWANKQTFRAHERTRARELFPFLVNITLPQAAPDFTLRVRNLRGLREIEWSPKEICLLIGGNGAGKSTLLLCLRLLSLAFKTNLADAVRTVFGGGHHLQHWDAQDEEGIEISLSLGQSIWHFSLHVGEGGVDARGKESFTQNGEVVFTRDSLGKLVFRGRFIDIGDKMGLRGLLERDEKLPDLKKFERFLIGIRLLHDPDLFGLRKNGSFTKDDAHLFSRAENVLTMLRSWHQNSQQRFRFDFVEAGMRDAFPMQIDKIDFNDNGTTLVARLSRPGHPEQPLPLENQPNGVLQMLILLAALASADECSVLALDEPENCLHPYALKAFVRQAKMWAKRQHLTVILATHSVALLNIFSTTPEQVFVMKAKDGEHQLPQRLDELYDRGWLECFQLGELFEREELVSNGDE